MRTAAGKAVMVAAMLASLGSAGCIVHDRYYDDGYRHGYGYHGPREYRYSSSHHYDRHDRDDDRRWHHDDDDQHWQRH